MNSKIIVAGALAVSVASACSPIKNVSASAAESYGPYPITLKGYSGDKTNSVAYTGQIARHVLQNSLKKLAGKGNGQPNEELKAQMMSYFAGSDAGRPIVDPKTKGDFKIKQTVIGEISKKTNLKGKTFKGLVPGMPGQMTGREVVEMLIDRASSANKGWDPLIGWDYGQLISKFMMGAVFYNQAVDNYLDEKLNADNKPNNKPYKKGAYYTGKEHSWDEGFGYFGVPAHAMSLTGAQAYGIAKKKSMADADANGDGTVDLVTEMTFGHGYYAADADKGGSHYMHTITKAFIDGRKLIASAKGEALTDAQRAELKGYAKIISTEWEKVIAEATFKYAGSVFKDLEKLETIIEANGKTGKVYRAYGKHWGELKGFALALQTSGRDLGPAAVQLNRLVGFGPALLEGGQLMGFNNKGLPKIGGNATLASYKADMVKVQALLDDRFGLEVKKNEIRGN